MAGAQTRECPFCKEQIRADAVKCRYCGEFLSEGAKYEIREVFFPIGREIKLHERYSARKSFWAMFGPTILDEANRLASEGWSLVDHNVGPEVIEYHTRHRGGFRLLTAILAFTVVLYPLYLHVERQMYYTVEGARFRVRRRVDPPYAGREGPRD